MNPDLAEDSIARDEKPGETKTPLEAQGWMIGTMPVFGGGDELDKPAEQTTKAQE